MWTPAALQADRNHKQNGRYQGARFHLFRSLHPPTSADHIYQVTAIAQWNGEKSDSTTVSQPSSARKAMFFPALALPCGCGNRPWLAVAEWSLDVDVFISHC
jgi:hypothetical protein